MNYHLMIDHFFNDNFIEIAEKVAPNNNTYIFTFNLPAKFVKSNKGIIAPYGSDALKNIVENITINDRIYVHWFHNDVIQVIDNIDYKIPIYLMFWGGDFLEFIPGHSEYIYEPLTKKNIKKNNKKIKSLIELKNPVKLFFLIRHLLCVRIFNLKKQNNDFFIRKRFLKRLNYFCHWNVLDYDIIKSGYNESPVFLNFMYGFDYASIPLDKPNLANDKILSTIWLGNSDTETNNHLDAIDALMHFKNNNLKIICPLSYGFGKDYGDLISSEGKKIFDDKWTSIREFMPFSEYIKLFVNVDIVIMYHNRTQASGNILIFIIMGKKVFLKSQSSLFQLLINLGIVVFDANTTKTMSFEEFSKPLTDDQIKSNQKKILAAFSDEKRIEYLTSILN